MLTSMPSFPETLRRRYAVISFKLIDFPVCSTDLHLQDEQLLVHPPITTYSVGMAAHRVIAANMATREGSPLRSEVLFSRE